MLTAWTKHLKSEVDKERFRSSLIGSRQVLERAVELLEENISSLEREENSMKQYDNPSWAFRQAHINGRKAELANVIRLLTLDQKDEDEYIN